MLKNSDSDMSYLLTLKEYALTDNVTTCNGDNGIVVLPVMGSVYKKEIERIGKMIQKLDQAFLLQIFSPSDFSQPGFSCDNYDFINTASLVAVTPLIERRTGGMGSSTVFYRPDRNYFFFNATARNEKRTFVIKRDFITYSIKEIRHNDILSNLMPFFYFTEHITASELSVTLCAEEGNIVYSGENALLFFTEDIAKKSFFNYSLNIEKKINADSEEENDDSLLDVALDVFVPFWSCINDIREGKKVDALISCGADIIFTLFPCLKGAYAIAETLHERFAIRMIMERAGTPIYKTLISEGIEKIPHEIIVSSGSGLRRISHIDFPGLRKDIFNLIIGTMDPCFGTAADCKKMLAKIGKYTLAGDVARLAAHSIKSVYAMGDFTNTAVSLKEGAESAFNIIKKSTERVCDEDSAPHSCSVPMLIKNNQYNLLSLGEDNIFAGDTGEITPDGRRLLAMVSTESASGIFTRFVCTNPASTRCELSVWQPRSMKHLMLKHIALQMDASGRKEWIFSFDENITRLAFYPHHKFTLLQDGDDNVKTGEFVEINGVINLFFPEQEYFRPLLRGDLLLTELRKANDTHFYVKRGGANDIIIEYDKSTEFDDFSIQYHYTSKDNDCPVQENILSLTQNGRIFSHIEGECFQLHSDVKKNIFILESNDTMQPSFRVGWFAKSNRFVPVKPYTGESTIHAALSLDNFITVTQSRGLCQGETLDALPVMLISGAAMHRGLIWIKLIDRYYRLEPHEDNIFSLYCNKRAKVFAWLYYDLYTESFEFISQAENISQAILDKEQSNLPFEKLIIRYTTYEQWSAFMHDINKSWLNNSTDSVLRFQQAVLLQHLSSSERMATLMLPVAQLRSWTLHPDVAFLRERYPALALWYGWLKLIADIITIKKIQPMFLVKQQELKIDDSLQEANVSTCWLITPGAGVHQALMLSHLQQDGSERYEEKAAVWLYKAGDTFQPFNFTRNAGLREWLPDEKYIPQPAVTQFMYEKNPQFEIKTDDTDNSLWVVHPQNGLMKLAPFDAEIPILYIMISPKGNWLATLDSSKFLTFFALNDPEHTFTHTDNSVLITPVRNGKLPTGTETEKFHSWAVNDEGEFCYSSGRRWSCLTGRGSALYFSKYELLFITPDQRFFAFHHPQTRNAIKLYDRKLKKTVSLSKSPSQFSVISVAFSPFNALLALAFDDSTIYVYDLVGIGSVARVHPVASIVLDTLPHKENQRTSNVSQNIIMRFDGSFQYLTLIHENERSGTVTRCSDNTFVRRRYAFSQQTPPSESGTRPLSASEHESSPGPSGV